MLKHALVSKLAAALFAVTSVSAYAQDYKCPPGISKQECDRRKAQSARDKARNQQQKQQNQSNGGNRYTPSYPSNRDVDYRTGNQPKYGSDWEREQAKRDRKAARDRGETTSNTDVIYRKDGGKTVVTNRTDPYGRTTTDVQKYDRYGNIQQDKDITIQQNRWNGTADVSKRITDFGSRGDVQKITRERSTAFRNSSQYNTIYSRETTYKNYRKSYGRYYQSPKYVSRGFRGGYYYDLRPVYSIEVHFSNPIVFWLFNSYYEDNFYRSYYGYEYQPFYAFSHAGVFYPTEDLMDLARYAAGLSYYQASNFRQAMQTLASQLEAKLPGRLGANDVVITHSEVTYGNFAVVEGYVNSYGSPFAFKALLDFSNGYNTLVFIPSAWDRDPYDYELSILDQINSRVTLGY